ncbi:urea ABC transporter substrate-binding protein [Amycolatopsis azurea]|uniref:urea ABC transporter substrate-binding protein n=1 Tax=Amycolatopsis azurea TaxID=36819 RepID=UPI00382DDCAD
MRPRLLSRRDTVRKTIRVGILHSLTGPMSINEKSIVEAELLAIEEVNAKGGVLKRPVEPVLADGGSDADIFAREAERLCVEEDVCVIFGCWTSSSRKAVRPVIEKLNRLLFYPPTYEGLEESPNIFYMGGAPSQQILPAVHWLLDNRGTDFFFVGSDYVWPRSSRAILGDILGYQGGSIVGESYLRMDQADVKPIVEQILDVKPHVIVNMLAHSHLAFFNELGAVGLEIPTFSLAFGEDLLSKLDPRVAAGGYMAWGYFHSLDIPENKEFVEAFKNRYGAHRVTDDTMHNAYVGVRLWANAAKAAGSTDSVALREALRGRSLRAPQGQVWVDEENHHLWRNVRIGQIKRSGRVDVIWSSETLLRPVPYPPSRPRGAWDALLSDMYANWDDQWVCPADGD